MKLKQTILIIVAVASFNVYAQPVAEKTTVGPGMEVTKLSDKAYFYVSYDDMGSFGVVPCNGLILVNGGEAALLDTPATDERTAILVDWIKNTLHAKLTKFIPNHWHSDCMGGLSYLQKIGVESYANQMTIDIAREKKLPVPDHGFIDSLTVKLGDMDLCCYYPGGGHAADNIVVWIPSEKILFGGCMVKDVHAKGLGNLSDAVLDEWPATIGKVIKKYPDARVVIPGHGDMGGKELLLHTQELLQDKK
ncbi:subclass B1 metallo-beta-lactamase [uncultured Bacteroides sp.]|uniref:subclass B1 metallo-beta-lactamase n=1 Tax=uncultured Bacteroides sp. TaxID=162156 RepID=UPI00374A5670